MGKLSSNKALILEFCEIFCSSNYTCKLRCDRRLLTCREAGGSRLLNAKVKYQWQKAGAPEDEVDGDNIKGFAPAATAEGRHLHKQTSNSTKTEAEKCREGLVKLEDR